jgi:hypothetical protein
MATVAADVEEAAQLAVAAADEDDGDVARPRRGVRAGLGHLPGVADVLPGRGEDALQLAPELFGTRKP